MAAIGSWNSTSFMRKTSPMSILNPKKIKNIVFDLGGVIVELDREAHQSAFQKLANAPFEDIRSRVVNDQRFKDLENGALGADDFRVFLRSVLQSLRREAALKEDLTAFTDEKLDAAWKTVIGRFKSQNVQLLQDLKNAGYRLALFSNINPVHYEEVKRVYERDLRKKYETFEALFDGRAFYSHLVGMSKPDPLAFQAVLKKAAFLPEETLFLDDTAEHIGGAREAGITAKLTDIEDVLLIKDHLFSSH
jgi:FMN phosphatase YigB (HAD superfamily)